MFATLMQVFGGLAIFIYGMKLMSDGLHQVAGEKMRGILRMFSANPLVAVASGAAVTCVIQSSSASTVMVIGFVNSGLMKLGQAIGCVGDTALVESVLGHHVHFSVTCQDAPMDPADFLNLT